MLYPENNSIQMEEEYQASTKLFELIEGTKYTGVCFFSRSILVISDSLITIHFGHLYFNVLLGEMTDDLESCEVSRSLITVSQDEYASLPSYMKILASWEVSSFCLLSVVTCE